MSIYVHVDSTLESSRISLSVPAKIPMDMTTIDIGTTTSLVSTDIMAGVPEMRPTTADDAPEYTPSPGPPVTVNGADGEPEYTPSAAPPTTDIIGAELEKATSIFSLHIGWTFSLHIGWRELFIKLVMVLLSVSAGVIAVTQSGLNVHLSHWCGDPLRAAFISTLIGVAELYLGMMLLMLTRKSNGFSASLRDQLKKIKSEIQAQRLIWPKINNHLNVLIWPGILGVVWLSTVIFLTPVLGFGLYFISCISGQIMSSVFIDHFGLFWSDTRTLSIPNAVGVAVALFGIFVFSLEVIMTGNSGGSGQDSQHMITIVSCSALSVFVGCCLTVQSSLNGKLKLLLDGTAYVVTLISFTNSIVVLFVASIVTYWVKGDWFVFQHEELEWYIFNGGFMGPFIVGIYVICPQHIGFSATFIAGISGYLGSSVVFDHYGIWGESTVITLWKALGVMSVLIASILVNV